MLMVDLYASRLISDLLKPIEVSLEHRERTQCISAAASFKRKTKGQGIDLLSGFPVRKGKF